MPAHRIAVNDRFWSKVNKTDACWLWTASIRRGYGRIRIDGRDHQAHRVAFELLNGRPVEHGKQLCHRCDVRNCVNPAHLFEGTSLDNKTDAVVKGRSVHGAMSPHAKFTDATVVEARACWASGRSIKSLAAQFGLSRRAVMLAVKGLTWRHIA